MSGFELAIPLVIKHEGGLVYDPVDPGGITNKGISLRFLRSLAQLHPEIIPQLDIDKNNLLDGEDVKAISLEDAAHLYRRYWWEPYGYENIKNQSLANKLLDLSINLGPKVAAKLLQKAYCQINSSKNLQIDGILGKNSFKYINELEKEQINKLLITFCDFAAGYYQNLVKQYPVLKKFLNGWLRRVYDF